MQELTGKNSNVSFFSDSYNPMQDVKIFTCLVAYTDEYVRTWILVFNAVFWFGTSTDYLLINPNQIRMVRIVAFDDPFDKNRKLGITHAKVFIPFSTGVTTVYFDSRVPTQQ